MEDNIQIEGTLVEAKKRLFSVTTMGDLYNDLCNQNETLKFECETLHALTDELQGKLKSVEQMLQHGLLFHKLLVENNPNEDNTRQLDFIKDLLSIVKAPMHVEETKPRLKSLKDLNHK